MKSRFESLFTTKDLVRSKYPNGWIGWLNDKMSDDDDGKLTRFTTMDGRHMHYVVEKLINYGFKPPILKNNNAWTFIEAGRPNSCNTTAKPKPCNKPNADDALTG